MASGFGLMLQGAQFRNPASKGELFGMMAFDTVLGAGASAGIGQLYGRYPDKWYGKYAPWLAGGIGKILEGILIAFNGPAWVSGAVAAVGQAGVNAVALDLSLDQVRKAKGYALVKVPAGTDVRALRSGSAVPASTAVGALQQAADGRGLAWDHIQELASMH